MDIPPTIKNDAIGSEVRNQKMMRTYQKDRKITFKGLPLVRFGKTCASK